MSSAISLIEDFDDKKHADPLDDKRSIEFPWDELEQRLGEAKAALPETDFALLSTALSEILRWMVDCELERPGWETIIARRVLGLTWALNPSYFEGSPSLTKLADRIKTHKATLSPHSAEASRKFNVRNRGQSHAWNANRGQSEDDAG